MHNKQKTDYHKWNHRQRVVGFVIPLLCLFCPLLQSQQSQLPEYKLKAVFLFNFTHFVDWPASTFNNDADPFIIGILGNDPLGNYIDEVVANEKIDQHPVRVVRYKSAAEIDNCKVLFIGTTNENLTSILPALTRRSILTVSDLPDFINSGGMIAFKTVDNKIRLQINPNTAKAAGLVLSSKLLSVADIIRQ